MLFFWRHRLSELPHFMVKTSWISAGTLNYDRRVDNLSTELTPNTSHPVFGTNPNPEQTGRDPWVSAEHIFVFFLFFFSSPPSSLCTHGEARNSWRRDSKVKTLYALAFVELKHKLLVWDILSRLNTNKRLNGIQSKHHLCRFSLLSVSTAALHGNIQSELVCTKKDASKWHLFCLFVLVQEEH